MKKLKLFGIDYYDKENVILERVFKEGVYKSTPILFFITINPDYPSLAWANNGDAISLQYAGTGALKSDFTR